jgi:glycerol-3-phosphate O-acyltransferase
VYEQIIVNESQLNELRALLQSKTDNVVLVPTHKSYMDSILLSYIHYHFKLEFPFACGNEAFFSLAIISILMKANNGFYLDNANMNTPLYSAVVDAYIWSLMKHNCLVEVSLE